METELLVIATSPNITIKQNLIEFSIYLKFSQGKIDSNILTINSDITYDDNSKTINEKIDCLLKSEINEILKYNCSINTDTNKTVIILQLYNDMDFNGTKPNRINSTINSANYSMTNLIKNKDDTDFDYYLKNGLNIFKNAKISYFEFLKIQYFTIEMDTYPNNYEYFYTIKGELPDINGIDISIECIVEKPSNYKLVMECMPYKDFIAHMNNTLFIVKIKNEKNFVIVFNKNENDLVNITRDTTPITITVDSTVVTRPVFSSSSKGFKGLYYYLIFFGSGLLIVIIIGIVCCCIKCRKRRYENNDVVSQVSSNSTEPQYNYPKF